MHDVLTFLLMKKPPRLVGRRCTSRREPERAGGLEGYAATPGELVRCGRPVWGDGEGVNGRGEGLCSRCWHEWNAFHGDYTTMQANPAASLTDIFGRRGDALPEVGAEHPDTFPEDWLTDAA